MPFDETTEGMKGFYNKKLNADVSFFSRGGYVTSNPTKKTASDWVCKQCSHTIPVVRKGSKLDTNPPQKCEMCGHTTFTLLTKE